MTSLKHLAKALALAGFAAINAAPSWAVTVTDSLPVVQYGSSMTIGGINGGTASSAAAEWTFDAGNEFPGATASLNFVTEPYTGRLEAQLGYNICASLSLTVPVVSPTGCGAYVKMTHKLTSDEQSFTAGTAPLLIQTRLRNASAQIQARLRLLDSTGQTLQYNTTVSTLEQSAVNGWTPALISTASTPLSFYGGANDGIPHPPYTSVAVLAVNMNSSIGVPAGVLEIDSLAFIQYPGPLAIALRPSMAVARPSTYTSWQGRVAVSAHQLNSIEFSSAHAAGIDLIRRDLTWDLIETTPGVYNFSEFDKWSSAASSLGMSMLWILDYSNPLYSSTSPATTTAQQAYMNYAKAAAAHYTSGTYGFEAWNEPNMSKYWTPAPSPPDYTSLVNLTSPVVSTYAPGAKKISGGTAGIDLPWYISLSTTNSYADVGYVAIHPYRQTAPESVANDIPHVRGMMAPTYQSLPILNTEWGYPSYGYFSSATYGDGHDPRARARQGVLVERMVLSQLALDMPLITLYDLMDDGTSATSTEDNFGLLDTAGVDKPAMTGLRAIYQLAASRTQKGMVSGLPPGIHALRWDSSTDRAYAIWSDNTTLSVNITLPAGTASATQWDGTPISATSGSVLPITEAGGPVLVVVKLACKRGSGTSACS